MAYTEKMTVRVEPVPFHQKSSSKDEMSNAEIDGAIMKLVNDGNNYTQSDILAEVAAGHTRVKERLNFLHSGSQLRTEKGPHKERDRDVTRDIIKPYGKIKWGNRAR
jgi:hypothetical protein